MREWQCSLSERLRYRVQSKHHGSIVTKENRSGYIELVLTVPESAAKKRKKNKILEQNDNFLYGYYLDLVFKKQAPPFLGTPVLCWD